MTKLKNREKAQKTINQTDDYQETKETKRKK